MSEAHNEHMKSFLARKQAESSRPGPPKTFGGRIPLPARQISRQDQQQQQSILAKKNRGPVVKENMTVSPPTPLLRMNTPPILPPIKPRSPSLMTADDASLDPPRIANPLKATLETDHQEDVKKNDELDCRRFNEPLNLIRRDSPAEDDAMDDQQSKESHEHVGLGQDPWEAEQCVVDGEETPVLLPGMKNKKPKSIQSIYGNGKQQIPPKNRPRPSSLSISTRSRPLSSSLPGSKKSVQSLTSNSGPPLKAPPFIRGPLPPTPAKRITSAPQRQLSAMSEKKVTFRPVPPSGDKKQTSSLKPSRSEPFPDAVTCSRPPRPKASLPRGPDVSSSKKLLKQFGGQGLLPNEIWMQIFSFLGPRDLGTCSQCCTLWNQIISSSHVWHEWYTLLWPPKARALSDSLFSKHDFIARSLKERKAAIGKLNARPLDTYTGYPDVPSILKKMRASWHLTLVRQGKPVFQAKADSVQYFGTSVLVLFHSVFSSENVTGNCALQIHTKTDVFPEYMYCSPTAPSRGPSSSSSSSSSFSSESKSKNISKLKIKMWRQTLSSVRSCSLVHEEKIGAILPFMRDSSSSIFVDSNIYLKRVSDCMSLALWGKGEEGAAAFLALHIPYLNLLHKALSGNPSKQAPLLPIKSLFDDIDPIYGLHHYHATIEIHDTKGVIFGQRFSPIDTHLTNTLTVQGTKYFVFEPIDPKHVQHVTKHLSLTWTAGAFQKEITHCVFMSVGLSDEHLSVMWGMSSLLTLVSPEEGQQEVSYDFEGECVCGSAFNANGGIQLSVITRESGRTAIISRLRILIRVEHVNEWFGTSYYK